MKANNVNNAMKQLVVRISPITGQPVIFDALSKDNGQLSAWVGAEQKIVGLDFYAAAQPMEEDIAKQVVQAFATQNNIPMESLIVRHRLPKSNAANVSLPRQRNARKTNDANLKIVKDDQSSATLEQRVAAFHEGQKQSAEKRNASQEAAKKDAPKDKLTDAVQALQDARTSVHGKRKEDKPEPAKASAEKPEGAVVKRTAEEKKPAKEAASKPAKRAYQRKPAAERSAKSKAAYERYVKEISANASEALPNFMVPVKPGEGISQETLDDETMKFAIRLAKLLKGIM